MACAHPTIGAFAKSEKTALVEETARCSSLLASIQIEGGTLEAEPTG